jgi:hypothetical protein
MSFATAKGIPAAAAHVSKEVIETVATDEMILPLAAYQKITVCVAIQCVVSRSAV